MMPTMVLMPGLHGTARLFDALTRVMPGHIPRRALAYPTDRVCDYAGLDREIEESLKGEGEMVLIAESFSGALALRFAAAHPERVRAVVLCVSFVGPPVPRVLCYLATPLIWLRCPMPGVAVRMFLAGFGASREVVQDAKREVGRVRTRVLAHRVRQVAWVNAGDALRRCGVPILCLAGRRDRLVGSRSVRRIRRIRGDVVVRKIDGPHLLLQTQPEKVWREISAFLRMAKIHDGVEVNG